MDARDAADRISHEVPRLIEEEKAAYAHGRQRPLGSYVALMGIYGAGVAGLSNAGRKERAVAPRTPPTRRPRAGERCDAQAEPSGRQGPGDQSAPSATRFAAWIFTALTAADFLQFAYAVAEQSVGE